MEKIPFTKMNYLLVNSKKYFWDLKCCVEISFFEYVKSQVHYPLVSYIHSRNIEIYKDVYLHLIGREECDLKLIETVLRYFYYDIYYCLVNTNTKGEEFEIDLGILDGLFPRKEFPSDLSLNKKVIELLKAYQSESIYLLWR